MMLASKSGGLAHEQNDKLARFPGGWQSLIPTPSERDDEEVPSIRGRVCGVGVDVVRRLERAACRQGARTLLRQRNLRSGPDLRIEHLRRHWGQRRRRGWARRRVGERG